MTVEVGNAYDLSDVAGSERVLWVCLFESSPNNQIFNLVPAVLERPNRLSVEVQSNSGSMGWLIPAISVPIHRIDLESRAIASRFILMPTDLDIEALMEVGDPTDELVDDLRSTARKISDYFHTSPDRHVFPDIEDCFILEEGSSSVSFAWRHDTNRRYVLRSDGGQAVSLRQVYGPGDDSEWPADAPLKIGSKTIAFNVDGSTVDAVSTIDAAAIRSALGLKGEAAATKALEPPRKASALVDWVFGDWRLAAVSVLLAGIAAAVILLQPAKVPNFEIFQAYATTGVRSGGDMQPGVLMELRAADVVVSADYFVEALGNAGMAVRVEQLPADGTLVIGEGKVEASETLRELLDREGVDLAGREFIEIAILPRD